jgi:hypothetical protein
MNNDDTSSSDAAGVSRRSTLILAPGVATLPDNQHLWGLGLTETLYN